MLALPARSGAEGFQNFTGSTNVGALFNRPNSACGATGTSVQFIAQRFRLDEPAKCWIYGAQNYDGYLHLYQGNFNPAAPTVNCLSGNDDGPDLGRGLRRSRAPISRPAPTPW